MTLRYFKISEFACKGQNCCNGSNLIDHVFVEELDQLRHELGFPLVVTSGYRCPKYNAKVSTTGEAGPHTTGRAVDLDVNRERAYKVVRLAAAKGFTGIGVAQKGASRFIHLDNLPNAPGQPRPTIWSY
jgi:zinc D-Ala-D-Ala carboxypeptidase